MSLRSPVSKTGMYTISITSPYYLAVPRGFEPRRQESRSWMLPLHQGTLLSILVAHAGIEPAAASFQGTPDTLPDMHYMG